MRSRVRSAPTQAHLFSSSFARSRSIYRRRILGRAVAHSLALSLSLSSFNSSHGYVTRTHRCEREFRSRVCDSRVFAPHRDTPHTRHTHRIWGPLVNSRQLPSCCDRLKSLSGDPRASIYDGRVSVSLSVAGRLRKKSSRKGRTPEEFARNYAHVHAHLSHLYL